MARRCKVCGDEMTFKVGEHYRDTGKGLVRYKNVRLYTCPSGCRGTYYDYRIARPADRPERILGVIPVPSKVVNVVDPLLLIGLLGMAVLLIGGFLAAELPVAIKSVMIVGLVTFGVWLANTFATRPEDGENQGGS